ncbi:MAG: glycosyltransferase [Acidimicrobiia bacterium]|nr:glycosyltransferase [Acidimicrobiia bacterium]
MRTLAMLSMHTSPLAQPGAGDGGGMNVYVRELASSLAQAGVAVDVFTRRYDDSLAEVVDVEPGLRVVHVPAGPADLTKEELPSAVEAYTAGVLEHLRHADVGAIHANYWLSGLAGHWLKHELELPLVSTFHTLARVKAITGDREPQRRIDAEAEVIACSDAITASCPAEADDLVAHYGADRSRIELVPPGVLHAFFSPGEQAGARAALGLDDDRPVLLFVGRIQPLKGVDVAVEALAAVRRRRPDALLVIVGGASGADGTGEVERIRALIDALGLADNVRFVEPQPHHLLSTYYRAADVVVVPSRSESFGLVALEAAACGTPVVAAAVGGLRTLVDHGRTGFLVDARDPLAYAAAIEAVLDDPALATLLSKTAAAQARGYRWSTTAARLRRLYADLTVRDLVSCA